MLALAMPVQAQSPANPLRELQSAEGGVVVHYERATADAGEFGRLADAAMARGLVLVLADGTPDQAGHRLAEAFVGGMRNVFPSARLAAGAAPAGQGYQVSVGVVSRRTTLDATEKVYGTRQGGMACKPRPDNSLVCDDVGSAGPAALGTRPVQVAMQRIEVVIRMFRIGADGSRVAVFEDAYALDYRDQACGDGLAAASTIAAALGKAVRQQEPMNIRFDSSAGPLRCGKG